MKQIEQRIQRGIRRLDRYYPYWQHRINLDTLDMSSSTTGLVEQLFGRYADGLKLLKVTHADAAVYGFDIPGMDSDENERQWQELTAAWKTVLQSEKISTNKKLVET